MTPLPKRQEVLLLSCLLALFLCRAVIAGTIVPRWQNPDEPQHFALAYQVATSGEAEAVQREVLQSMIKYRWWKAWDDLPPEPEPINFLFVDGLGSGTLAQPLYYLLAARVLTVTAPDSIDDGLQYLRALSLLLSVVTLILGWAGTRLLFGQEIALGAAGITAVQPQYMLTAITVNADSLLYVWGAFCWWQIARFTLGRQRALSLTLLLLGAVAAALTKRIGLVLVGAACVGALFSSLATNEWRLTRGTVRVAGVALAAAIIALGAGMILFERQAAMLMQLWSDPLNLYRRADDWSFVEPFKFLRMTIDYTWFVAGWVRFLPSEPALWATRILLVGGLVSGAVALLRTRHLPLTLAWLFVAAHLVTMVVVVFLTVRTAPQARYLFPAFAPLMAVLYVGLSRAAPPMLRRHCPVAIVAILAVLDITAFTTVLIPIFLEW